MIIVLIAVFLVGAALASPSVALADSGNRVTCDASYSVGADSASQSVKLTNCKPASTPTTIGDGLIAMAWAVGVIGVIWGFAWGGGALINK